MVVWCSAVPAGAPPLALSWLCPPTPTPALMGREYELRAHNTHDMEDKPPSRTPSPPPTLATLLPVNLSIATTQALVVVSALPASSASPGATPLSVTPVLLTAESPSAAAPPASLDADGRAGLSAAAPSPEPVRTCQHPLSCGTV